MDSLDIRLLRAMFPTRVFALTGVDPSVSVQDLSRAAHASRVTVRRRLDRWKEEGFWKRAVVFPNPDQLECSFLMQSFTLDPGQSRDRLEDTLIKILEPAFLFQTEYVYNPVLFSESREDSDRRQTTFRATGTGRANCPPIEIPFPGSTVALGARDWEIIRALRSSPTLDLSAVANVARITLRGLERRVARLMAAHALFFFPELDFRRSPGSVAWVGVLFRPGADPKRLESELTRKFPDLFPVENFFPFQCLLPPAHRPSIGGSFPFFLPVPSASTGDQLRRDIGSIPDVAETLVGFPTQNISVPSSFDKRIDNAIARFGKVL